MAVKKHSSLDRVLGRLDTLDSVNLANLVQRLARERGVLEGTLDAMASDRLADRVAPHGRVGRAYLGVSVFPTRVPESLREKAGAARGLVVVGLDEAAPAARDGRAPAPLSSSRLSVAKSGRSSGCRMSTTGRPRRSSAPPYPRHFTSA